MFGQQRTISQPIQNPLLDLGNHIEFLICSLLGVLQISYIVLG